MSYDDTYDNLIEVKSQLKEFIKKLNEKEKELEEDILNIRRVSGRAVLRAQLKQLQSDRDSIKKILEE